MVIAQAGFNLNQPTRLGQVVACWFQCLKTDFVSFECSNNCGAIDVKMDIIISIPKIVAKTTGALICTRKFLASETAIYFYKSINDLAWNTAYHI